MSLDTGWRVDHSTGVAISFQSCLEKSPFQIFAMRESGIGKEMDLLQMHQDAIFPKFCDHSLGEMQPTPHPNRGAYKKRAKWEQNHARLSQANN